MCECVKGFLACLKPIIIDLDYQKEELEKVRNELEKVTDFLMYTNDDIKNIGEYNDQEYIYQNLASFSLDENTYKAIVYLINSDNPQIKCLPQYHEAVKALEGMNNSFKVIKENLTELESKNSEDYEYKSLAKKYYDLFNEEVLFVPEQKEFVDFLLTTNLEEYNKVNLINYVIKVNVSYYRENENNEIEVDREQDLVKIQEIIYKNKMLLSEEYSKFMEMISKQVNLSMSIKDIYYDKNVSKIDINNLILAKRIWLTNQITQNYKSCAFGRVSKYIKEYDELMVLKEKIKNINDKDKIEKIIKGGY